VTSFPIKERWFPEDSDKWSQEEREEKEAAWKRLKEHERTTLSYPEDEKWNMFAKHDNLSRNEFLLREYVIYSGPS
jgi:hypothetical protein